jgi:HAD superfamily hydrolase (TIGR01509 family)
MSHPPTLIFDFDGTLVDTLPLHYEAYRDVFASLGLDLTEADFFPHCAGNARETIPRFLRGRACSVPASEIHRRKKERIAELFATRPIPILKTARLLEVFHGRLRMALASSGSRQGIDVLLERLNWRSLFAVVVTGEDAERGKPAPDLFIETARRLGVPPAACLVFEDTDDGLQAARVAGMACVDVREAGAHRRSGGHP